ncbi:MAG: UvrD-helicase domain-containing protein [Deltaproteobacteria bacterium]|nr:UvrD-helicase domain-containing protein [Deltaproteobacteria bacterium]
MSEHLKPFLKFEQNCVISAGAGSGKTKTLVGLYVSLIEQGIRAKEIVAITFTDKAASELKERIEKEIESRAGLQCIRAMQEISDAPISTFHTFCARILREHSIEAGIIPDCKVIDEYESLAILKNVIRKTVIGLADAGDEDAAVWIRSIGFQGGRGFTEMLLKIYQNIRGHGIEITDLESSSCTISNIRSFLNILKVVDNNYSKAKRDISSLDFQDLLIFTKRLLLKNKGVRSFYKKVFKKIMVDEFQDTNNLQASIVYLLAEMDEITGSVPSIGNLADSKLIVVGDMKQSIYGFRGADVIVFEDVVKGAGSSGVVYLTDNHRSCKNIVSFVNALFIHHNSPQDIFNENAVQNHTRSETDDFNDTRIEVILFEEDKKAKENRRTEADTLAKRIKQLVGKLDVWEKNIGKRKTKYSDIAILLRTLNDVDIYEESLRQYAIPYYIVKGRGFYHCQEVIDVYNILQHIEHGDSHISLAGFLRSPFAGLMDETLFRLCRTNHGARELYEGFYNETDFEDYPKDETEKISLARKWLIRWKDIKDNLTIAELIEEILTDSGYLGAVIPTFQGEQKAANIKKLIEVARRFEREGNATIRDFICYLKSLFDEPPREPEAQITTEGMDVVRIMTIHQAKGLEFPVVFIPDVCRKFPSNKDNIVFHPSTGIAAKDIGEDGEEEDTSVFKEAKTIIKAKDIQESIRIFYVACTRARDYLILSKLPSRGKENWGALLDGIMKREMDEFIKSDKSTADITIDNKTQVKLSRGDNFSYIDEKTEIPCHAIKYKKEPAQVIKDVFDFIPLFPREFTAAATILADFMVSTERFEITGIVEGEETVRQMARDIGSLIHIVLEKMDYNMAKKDESYITNLVKDFAKGWFLQNDELDAAVSCITGFLRSSIFKEITGADEVYREFPFFMPIKENGFTLYIKGVIDLLYRKGENWKIIDYKYLEPKEYENYKNQIKIYSLAIVDGFSLANIESSLLFMKDGICVSRQEGFDMGLFKKEMLEAGKRLCACCMNFKDR